MVLLLWSKVGSKVIKKLYTYSSIQWYIIHLMLRRLLNDFLYTFNSRVSFAFPRKQLKALGFRNQRHTVGLQGGWTPTHRATAVSPLSHKLLVGWFKGRLSRREGCFISASVSPKPPKSSFQDFEQRRQTLPQICWKFTFFRGSHF